MKRSDAAVQAALREHRAPEAKAAVFKKSDASKKPARREQAKK